MATSALNHFYENYLKKYGSSINLHIVGNSEGASYSILFEMCAK
jgi:hypothetical protein